MPHLRVCVKGGEAILDACFIRRPTISPTRLHPPGPKQAGVFRPPQYARDDDAGRHCR